MKYIRPQDVLPKDIEELYRYEAIRTSDLRIRFKARNRYQEDTVVLGSAESIEAFIRRFKGRHPTWELQKDYSSKE